MKDHSKKLNYLKENSESVFQELFGIGKSKEPEKEGNLTDDGMIVSNDFYKVKPDKSVVFVSNGSEVNSVVTGYASLREIIDNKNFSWITNSATKFTCDRISINKNKISLLKGEWLGGEFKGSKLFDFDFNGGFFNGGVFSSGRWNVNSHNFINGTINTPGSILGKNDITSFIQNKFKFNIIAVAEGNKITIQMQNGKAHEITMLKRLDSSDSNFKFKVKNGETAKEFVLPVPWSYLRGNSEEEHNKITVFSNSNTPELFKEKFGIEIISPILKVIVDDSESYEEEVINPGNEEQKTEELATTQQHYDLNGAKFIGIESLGGEYWNDNGVKVPNNVGRVYFNAHSSDILKQFENVVKNLDGGVLKSDFTTLKSWLSAKAITGAPANYAWLANLIGVDTTKREIEDQNFIGSLNRIEAFLRYFVDIIVKYASVKEKKEGDTNVSNDEVKSLIKTNLENLLGIKAADAAGEESAGEETQGVKGNINIKESIVKAVKNIISERL